MYSITKSLNDAQPVVVATNKATLPEAMAAAAQFALQAAGTMAVNRTAPQPNHYHKISVVIHRGSSVEQLCSNATHASVQIRWTAQEVNGQR
jgi:hypothetical protein